MPLDRILVNFLFIISVINVIGMKSQYEATVVKFVKEITSANQQRSLILVYNNMSLFEKFSFDFYSLGLPLYNIYLPELRKFNGKYNDKYDIRITFEETKLYFIVIDHLRDLYNDLLVMRKIYFWRDRDKLILFVNEAHDEAQLKQIFLFCFKYYIINIAIVFLGSNITSFTYNPFSGNYLHPLTNWTNFFPDKFQNLYGYKLRISMFPSVVNVFENGMYQGWDGIMSRTIAHHVNASYVYILPKVNELAPILNQYEDVANRIADVGFNTRYIKFNFKNLIEKTYPHDRDDLSCFIPTSQKNKITKLTTLLPEDVWFLVLGVSLFFLVYVVVSAKNQRQRFDLIDTSLMILLLLINKPVHEIKTSHFRLVLLTYLLFCFFVNTMLICRLTSILTAPELSHDIDTVKELAETNYKIITIDRFQELLNASLTLDLKEKILNRLELIDEKQYLNEMRKCKKVVFICKNHLAIYAKIQKENYPNGVQFYRIMKENILPTLSCYIVSYGSPFLMRFDTLVERIVESGIYNHWKKITWDKLGINYDFRYHRNNYGKRKKMSIEKLWIGIQVYLIGLGTSFLVFLFELSIKKTKCK